SIAATPPLRSSSITLNSAFATFSSIPCGAWGCLIDDSITTILLKKIKKETEDKFQVYNKTSSSPAGFR
ncbi:MAG: hypothetical protein ACOYBS_05190, partial [Flavobacterium sp.]